MSIDNAWNIVISTPIGERKGVLTLKSDGDALSGNLASPEEGSQDIRSGKVSGDQLSWELDVDKPMPMTLSFSAKIDGDNISGDVGLGMFGSAPFTGSAA